MQDFGIHTSSTIEKEGKDICLRPVFLSINRNLKLLFLYY